MSDSEGSFLLSMISVSPAAFSSECSRELTAPFSLIDSFSVGAFSETALGSSISLAGDSSLAGVPSFFSTDCCLAGDASFSGVDSFAGSSLACSSASSLAGVVSLDATLSVISLSGDFSFSLFVVPSSADLSVSVTSRSCEFSLDALLTSPFSVASWK